MGELILCRQMLAALPYYIEGASLNVYSLEELCFYIEHNLYLLEEDFMRPELCDWIGGELGLVGAAERLRSILDEGGPLSKFVSCILQQTSYMTREEAARIERELSGFSGRPPFERGRYRADRYVQNGRYVSAIAEYKKLLMMPESDDGERGGEIWHNMGVANARLFFFHEAAECFMRAYRVAGRPESLRECVFAYRMARDGRALADAAEAMRLDAGTVESLSRELDERGKMEESDRFAMQLSAAFEAGEDDAIYEILEEWKDTYRKKCRT